jgi:hypothetical protein
MVLMVSLALGHSVAKSVNRIETGMNTVHALVPSEAEGEAVVVVEVSPDTTMTVGPTGIGTGIGQGGMTTIMALDEVVAADLTVVDSTVIGMAVTAAHLKTVTRCPASNNILSLLGLLR